MKWTTYSVNAFCPAGGWRAFGEVDVAPVVERARGHAVELGHRVSISRVLLCHVDPEVGAPEDVPAPPKSFDARPRP